MASATRTISTDDRNSNAAANAIAMIGMITNIATSERPSSDGRRTRYITSLTVVLRPKPKTVVRMLTCKASTTACWSVMLTPHPECAERARRDNYSWPTLRDSKFRSCPNERPRRSPGAIVKLYLLFALGSTL